MSAVLALLSDEIGIARQSGWLLVSQTMIDQFAETTGDRQFIHIDPVRAAQTPFGGTVAHGFLTLALLPQLRASIPDPAASHRKLSINYGLDRLRFISPVRAGSRIRTQSTLLSVEQRGQRQFEQVHNMRVDIEAQEKPALIATWRTILTF